MRLIESQTISSSVFCYQVESIVKGLSFHKRYNNVKKVLTGEKNNS